MCGLAEKKKDAELCAEHKREEVFLGDISVLEIRKRDINRGCTVLCL